MMKEIQYMTKYWLKSKKKMTYKKHQVREDHVEKPF